MGVYGSCPILAATWAHQARVLEGVIWMGLLILLIIVGVGVAACVRQRAKASQRHRREAFTLEELRRLRNRGTVTPDEHDTLRNRIVIDLQQTVHCDR